jgi:ferredoxin/flavodoxin
MEEKRSVRIRYFTGTGNSLRVADICRQQCEAAGYTVTMAPIGRDEGGEETGEALLGLCFPVYSLGAPRIVRKFISRMKTPATTRKGFVIATAGDLKGAGWALVHAREALQRKGFDVISTSLVPMPNNWLPMSEVPSPAEAAPILARGEQMAHAIARGVLAGEERHEPLDLSAYGPVPSWLMRVAFHGLGVRRLWFFFRVSDRCKGCGQCARICPTASIRMEKGKPHWTRTCEQCLRCMNLCPSRAILQFESIGHGSTRNRHREPHFMPELG